MYIFVSWDQEAITLEVIPIRTTYRRVQYSKVIIFINKLAMKAIDSKYLCFVEKEQTILNRLLKRVNFNVHLFF